MARSRIGLALGAFAAMAVSLAGSPLAAANIASLGVSTDGQYEGTPQWQIFLVVDCDTASTPAPPVYVTDNGQPIPQSPLVVGPCGPSNSTFTYLRAPFAPTTLGAHHIAATQYKSDGSVLSTKSEDVNVTRRPCLFSPGSAQLLCNLTSGS
ncbi:hypothetical protein [Nocardia tengchongensis]|uniref:hypothetical protein n=1 Tax=Nocardia tengchongensis TaxID=2055889 RepID=UPI0036BA7063